MELASNPLGGLSKLPEYLPRVDQYNLDQILYEPPKRIKWSQTHTSIITDCLIVLIVLCVVACLVCLWQKRAVLIRYLSQFINSPSDTQVDEEKTDQEPLSLEVNESLKPVEITTQMANV